MLREYKFTLLSKLFMTGLLLLFPYIIRQTYIDGEIGKFLFFLIGAPIWGFGAILGYLLKLEINSDKISCNVLYFRKFEIYLENIERISDDYFSIVHFYHIVSRKKLRGISLTNGILSNYSALLVNIIIHVKPGTHVDDSILWHLNMVKEDIGKYYKQDKWIDKIKVNSYWKQKIF